MVILDFQSKNNWKNETTHYQFLCDLIFHLDFLIIFFNVFSSPSFLKTKDSSRPKVFCKKGAPKNFAKFTKKHMYRSLFLIHFQACGLRLWHKFFLRILQNFWEHFFNRTPPMAASTRKKVCFFTMLIPIVIHFLFLDHLLFSHINFLAPPNNLDNQEFL